MSIIIDQIRIDNFRGLKDFKMNLTKTTVLTGMNNTGKTSVLKAIQIALGNRSFLTRDDFYQNNGNVEDVIIIDLRIIPIDNNNNNRCDKFEDNWDILFSDKIQKDDKGQYMPVRIKFTFDKIKSDFQKETFSLTKWEDNDWKSIKGNKYSLPKEICFYYIEAQRDIVDDVRSKTSYFGRLLSEVSKSYDATDLREIETKLDTLNKNAIEKSSILTKIQETLKELDSALDRLDSKVSISPFAKRIMDLNKSVSIHYGTTQDSFTMDYHGMGTRSWSSLLTFKAFLQNQKSLLTTDDAVFPIVAVEEPEAHLHPNAQKMLYSQITTMPGQKIISTHSPYIVASSDLSEIRGLYKKNSVVKIGYFPIEDLDKESIRKIRQAVIKSKGELVFSRAIILVEGETEEQALPIMAEKYFKCSFSDLSIDFVGVGGSGNRYKPFIQLAKYLNIPWFIFSDGEAKTKKELDGVLKKVYSGKSSDDFSNNICIIPEDKDFEGMLIADGFNNLIEKTIGKVKEDPNYVRNYIKRNNNNPSGKRIKTEKVCDKCKQNIYTDEIRNYDGEEGYARALDDILSNMKTEFAPAFAIELKDSDLSNPSIVDDLFKKIKKQIYHE